MSYLPLIPAAAAVLTVFVWGFVLGRQRRAPVNVAFLICSGAAAIWMSLELLFYLPAFRGFELWILRAVGVFWMSLGFLFANFVYRLLGRKPDWFYWASASATVGAIVVWLIPGLVLLGFERHPWGVADINDPLLHSLLAVVPTAPALRGFWLIHDASRKLTDPEARRPMRLMLVGAFVAMGGLVTMNVLLPNLLGVVDSPRFGSSALAPIIALVFVAVIRHDFLSVTVEHVAEELFEDVRDGIVLVDQSGTIRRMNRAARSLFGQHRSPPAWPCPQDVVIPGLTLGERKDEQQISLVVDGERRTLAISQSRSEAGGVELGTILIVRDITEEKLAQEVLLRSRDELESEVEEYTEELRRVQKVESFGTLAGGIAHDFSNLLSPIMGFSSAALDDLEQGDPVRADLQEVLAAARRAKEIIRHLLTFSRPREPEVEVVDLGSMVASSLELVEATAPPMITIERDLCEEPCLVECDRGQLDHVLLNLCNNANEAMDDGGGTLTISLRPTSAAAAGNPLERAAACLAFKDTGRGMSDTELEEAFKPFYTTKPGGSGLGLATARRIIDVHGGALEIRSRRGQGTVLELYLPLVTGDGSPAETREEEPT